MTPNRFRLIVAIYLLSVALAITGHVMMSDALPPSLAAYVVEADKTAWITGYVGIAYLVLSTIANIGLLMFRSWARHLFVALVIFGAMPWDGPTVYPAMEYAFVNIEFMLAGVIAALAYFSPVSERFRARRGDIKTENA